MTQFEKKFCKWVLKCDHLKINDTLKSLKFLSKNAFPCYFFSIKTEYFHKVDAYLCLHIWRSLKLLWEHLFLFSKKRLQINITNQQIFSPFEILLLSRHSTSHFYNKLLITRKTLLVSKMCKKLLETSIFFPITAI